MAKRLCKRFERLPDTVFGRIDMETSNPNNPIAEVWWLRLPVYGMFYDIEYDQHLWGQRVLYWHGHMGFRLRWRSMEGRRECI